MQTIQNALSTWQRGSSVEALPQTWVARIFERLTAQLGAKMADLYAGVPADTVQAEWAMALADFHPGEIDRGIRACQTRAFAPTLGEFTRLCRPALDPEIAYLEAQTCLRQRDEGKIGDWSHPAVYRAACVLGHEVRCGNYREVRKRWEHQLALEFRQGWSEVPEPLVQIESQVKTRPPNEAELAKLREFRSLIAAGFTDAEVRLGMQDVVR